MLAQEPIQAAIWHCLNHYAYGDAIFLAERLHAEVNSDDTLHLLSTSYYRAGRKSQCYNLLKNRKTILNSKCRFLLAHVSSEMDNLPTCEEITTSDIDSITSTFADSAPFALKLFAKVCNQTDRSKLAKEALTRSLKLNPFLFDSFVKICELGNLENVEPEGVFQTQHLDNFSSCHGEESASGVDFKYGSPTPTTTTKQNSEELGVLHQSNRPTKFRGLFTSTPMGGGNSTGFGLLPLESSSESIVYSPFISPGLDDSGPRVKKPCIRWQQTGGQTQTASAATANVRRSSRLFSNSSNVSVKENSKTPTTRRLLTPTSTSKSPNRKLRTPKASSTYQENQKNREDEFGTPESSVQNQIQVYRDSADWLMQLLRDLGKCIVHLTKFECKETIELLNTLKPEQYNTGWVLGMIARAFFEMGDYEESVRHFTTLRHLDPFNLDQIPLLSTALWHLQREVDLSTLSHDLLTLTRQDAATWISAGNCFSLHKEHETAIKFFKRAIQVNPSYAYSYTLLGHEYVATEEHEHAMRCFRNAARIDPRHYNAWYGMGMIFYKQERFTRAEVYYNKALEIHPRNSVLLCHLGVVQQSLNRTEKSLATFTRALAANPNDPLCKFHRASVLFAVNRLDEALKELEELKQIVPKESLVYFLVAKVYSKKGDTHKALLHFSWATDLDPKGANNQIKESIEPVLSKEIEVGGDELEEEVTL